MQAFYNIMLTTIYGETREDPLHKLGTIARHEHIMIEKVAVLSMSLHAKVMQHKQHTVSKVCWLPRQHPDKK